MRNPLEVVPRSFKVFEGGCHAVVLNTRDEKDPHICVTLLTEDDENWFISNSGQFSSHWLPVVVGLFAEATEWLNKHASSTWPEKHGWTKRR